MNVLGIVGSARKRGNCALLLEEVMRGLRGSLGTETLFLSDHEIRPCDGCHRCEEEGRCWIEDDLAALSRKIEGADAVVLCSPTYMGGLSSRMRAFMERTWPLRKGQMSGKVGSHIVTGRRRIGVAVSAMASYFSHLGMTTLPGALGYAFAPGEIVKDEEAVQAAQRLARDLRRCLPALSRKRHGK